MRSNRKTAPRHTPDLTQPKTNPASDPSPEATMDEMLTKHGITRVSVDHFYTCGFHYTNLDDAIAQAKRSGSTS